MEFLLVYFQVIFWGLGLTISAYIFSIFTDLSPFVVAAAHDFLSIFILLAFLLVKEGKVRLSIFLNIRNVSVIIGALLAGPIGMQANLYAVKYIGSSFSFIGIGYLPCNFCFIGFLLFEAQDFEKYCVWDCLDYWRDYCSDL